MYDGGSGLLGPSANQQVPSEYLPKSAVEPPKVNVAIGAAAAKGVATPDPVLAKNEPRFRACARSAAAQNPLIDGKAKLTLTVDAEGSVVDAKVVASSTGTPSLDACFASVSRSLKFAGAGTVTFELALQRP